MKKRILVIAALCSCVCLRPIASYYCNVYARNMSTVSDVTLYVGLGGAAEVIYLPARPAGGAPIEKKSNFSFREGDELHWRVVKAIGDTTIGSGTFIAEDKWLEVDGTNGDWSCVWSDEPWD